jgi:hypothetical protein
MTQIPLYHRGRETGQLITLDDHLAPVISRVHWSTGDVRRPQSPRHVARFKGEPFTISLNRLVYALSHTPNLVHMDIFFAEIGVLKRVMALHPPLVFENGNVLDCTTANIIPRALSRKGQRSRDVTSDGDSPPFAPGQEPSPLERKILGNETAERFASIAPAPFSEPRDVRDNGNVDLSKLFSHLDASSDPSITLNKNDTNKKGS